MIVVLLALAFTAVVVSALSGSLLLLAAALIGVLLTFIIVHSELVVIQSALAADGGSKRGGRRSDRPEARTSLGRKLLQEVEVLRYRINTLSAPIGGSAQQTDGLDTETLEQGLENSAQELSGDEFYVKVVEFVTKRFRCRACALVLARPNGEMAVVANGASGEKFEQCLKHFISPYFLRGDASIFGLRDGFESESLLGDLSAFDCRYTVCWPLGASGGERGVLWLGYSALHRPSVTEMKWAKTLAEKVRTEMRTRQRLSELYSEIKRAQGADRAQSEYFANLSHDIRTPLNNVKNILALVKIEGFSSDTLKMVEAALDNCDQMSDMVEDILDYSRHQLGKLKAERRDLTVRAALERLVDSFRASAGMKGLKVEIIGEVPSGAIYVDPRHFRRMLDNIISNGIKYTKQGGVEVSFVDRPSELSFVVRDTGVGMTAEQVQRLFVPFTRFAAPGVEGVGLGLALTKILVELNGGTIACRSVYGRGTEFELTLPKAAATIVEEQFDTPLQAKPPHSNLEIEIESLEPQEVLSVQSDIGAGLKVLLVDDDPDYVNSVARGMKRYGFDVMTAYSVNEALGLLHYDTPDVAFTDGKMPNGGASKVIAALQVLEPAPPVVIVSGSGTEEERRAYQDLGPAAVLTKPVDLDAIMKLSLHLTQPKGNSIESLAELV